MRWVAPPRLLTGAKAIPWWEKGLGENAQASQAEKNEGSQGKARQGKAKAQYFLLQLPEPLT